MTSVTAFFSQITLCLCACVPVCVQESVVEPFVSLLANFREAVRGVALQEKSEWLQ